jgi:hypothetical protein
MMTDPRFWTAFLAALSFSALHVMFAYDATLPSEPRVYIGYVEDRQYEVRDSAGFNRSVADDILAKLLREGIVTEGHGGLGMFDFRVRRSKAVRTVAIIEATAKEHGVTFQRSIEPIP